ncbi:MAG: TauD/TfdA family dioxygenase [Acidimicrobiia bacterium]|nr:TauD/TfdA family dioxygenase [Acidimicrobiia bacterium]
MSTQLTATDVTLQSGVRVSELALAPGVVVRPTGGGVGVIVEGIDLAGPLDGATIRSLIAVWNHAGVVVLRDQEGLTPERQVEVVEWFGRRFHRGAGPDAIDHLPMVGALPVQLLSNRDRRKPGNEVISDERMAAATQELKMHSDVQDYSAPPDLTCLHALVVPPPEAGGTTYFWDLFAAYDDLDEPTRSRIGSMRWRPRSTYSTMKGVKQKAAVANDAPDQASPVTHPVVRTHPASGRRALWLSTFTERLVGEFAAEPAAGVETEAELRRRLIGHLSDERYRYDHVWQDHDVLLWDNRAVNHARDTWDGRYLREMHRAQAGGSVPF